MEGFLATFLSVYMYASGQINQLVSDFLFEISVIDIFKLPVKSQFLEAISKLLFIFWLNAGCFSRAELVIFEFRGDSSLLMECLGDWGQKYLLPSYLHNLRFTA